MGLIKDWEVAPSVVPAEKPAKFEEIKPEQIEGVAEVIDLVAGENQAGVVLREGTANIIDQLREQEGNRYSATQAVYSQTEKPQTSEAALSEEEASLTAARLQALVNSMVDRLEGEPGVALKDYQYGLERLSRENPLRFLALVNSLQAICSAAAIEKMRSAGVPEPVISKEIAHYKEVGETFERLSEGIPLSAYGGLLGSLGSLMHDVGKYDWRPDGQSEQLRHFDLQKDILGSVLSHELRSALTVLRELSPIVNRATGRRTGSVPISQEFWGEVGIRQDEAAALAPPPEFYKHLCGVVAGHGYREWPMLQKTLGTFAQLPFLKEDLARSVPLRLPHFRSEHPVAAEAVMVAYMVEISDNLSACTLESSVKYAGTNFRGPQAKTLEDHLNSYLQTCIASYVEIMTRSKEIETGLKTVPEADRFLSIVSNINLLIQEKMSEAWALKTYLRKLQQEVPLASEDKLPADRNDPWAWYLQAKKVSTEPAEQEHRLQAYGRLVSDFQRRLSEGEIDKASSLGDFKRELPQGLAEYRQLMEPAMQRGESFALGVVQEIDSLE